jgi:hypothetical protein
MYIREVKKQRREDCKVFYQYNLVQTSRIEGKVKTIVNPLKTNVNILRTKAKELHTFAIVPQTIV